MIRTSRAQRVKNGAIDLSQTGAELKFKIDPVAGGLFVYSYGVYCCHWGGLLSKICTMVGGVVQKHTLARTHKYRHKTQHKQAIVCVTFARVS